MTVESEVEVDAMGKEKKWGRREWKKGKMSLGGHLTDGVHRKEG